MFAMRRGMQKSRSSVIDLEISKEQASTQLESTESRYKSPVARHPVVTSQSVSGQGETRGDTTGGKKLLEDWLNVPNVNYASGVPGVP